MEEHTALLQINRAVSRVVGKNRVRADAGDCLVLGDEFGARRWAGAEHVRHFEDTVDGSALERLVLRRNDFHAVDDLREL